MLGLSAEFAGHENARDELAGALEKHGAFTRYLAAINEEGEKRKKTLASELSELHVDRDKRQVEIKSLDAAVITLRIPFPGCNLTSLMKRR